MDQPNYQYRTSHGRLRWACRFVDYVLIFLASCEQILRSNKSWLLKICLAVGLGIPLLPACQTSYLIKSAYSQANLLRQRIPLEEALVSPQLSAEQKRKIQLAQKASEFAEKELGLKSTQNYTTYVQLDGPYVTYVVSGAYKNELKHYLWSYPLVGSMPYKGFFDPDSAKKEAALLTQQNLDTFVRGVTAYSTLGWFKDPLLSSMLEYRDFDLVNTIIHETVHATVFIKSEAEFNESLATYIGNIGTEEFYKKTEGQQSSTITAMKADAQDEILFSSFINEEIASLEKWYTDRKSQEIPEAERMARLREIQTRFGKVIRPKLKLQESYKNFETVELNNARLLTYKMYLNDFQQFEAVFNRLGRDFKKMIDFCKGLEKAQDPKAELAKAAVLP